MHIIHTSRSLKVRQSQSGHRPGVSGHHMVEVSGPIMPHMVQALSSLAATNNTDFSVALQTLEETVSFSMFQGVENEVLKLLSQPRISWFIFSIFTFRTHLQPSQPPVWMTAVSSLRCWKCSVPGTLRRRTLSGSSGTWSTAPIWDSLWTRSLTLGRNNLLFLGL